MPVLLTPLRSTLTCLTLLLLLPPRLCAQPTTRSISCSRTHVCFSSGLSSGAVLQQAPARASLYGSVPAGSPVGAAVALELSWLSPAPAGRETFSGAVSREGTWKITLEPRAGGGSYSARVHCPACTGVRTAVITDLTFGEVWMCAGQSNAWLPLRWTLERDATAREVAAGGAWQRVRLWMGGLYPSSPQVEGWHSDYADGSNWVAPSDVVPGEGEEVLPGNMLINQWRTPAALLAAPSAEDAGGSALDDYPALCALTVARLAEALGAASPTFGVMTVAVGGTLLEAWASPSVFRDCRALACVCGSPYFEACEETAAGCSGNSGLFRANIEPFVNLTIAGWLFAQGEQNVPGVAAGENDAGSGYSCAFPATIAAWRALWSVQPGTTPALAPFGYVSLPDGTDMGYQSGVAPLRWAQTANYGHAPNPKMPNTFLGVGHDQGDPWATDMCADAAHRCCLPAGSALGPQCAAGAAGAWSLDDAHPAFMGPVHPRNKGALAARLAAGALAAAYGGAGIASGPWLAGCALAAGARALTLSFDAAALRGERLLVAPDASAALFLRLGSDWLPVRARAGPLASEVSVPLSQLPPGAPAPTAVRYAWPLESDELVSGRLCCGPADVAFAPCPPGSCPLFASGPGSLPALPFYAEITPAGGCRCAPPQTCDGVPQSVAEAAAAGLRASPRDATRTATRSSSHRRVRATRKVELTV